MTELELRQLKLSILEERRKDRGVEKYICERARDGIEEGTCFDYSKKLAKRCCCLFCKKILQCLKNINEIENDLYCPSGPGYFCNTTITKLTKAELIFISGTNKLVP